MKKCRMISLCLAIVLFCLLPLTGYAETDNAKDHEECEKHHKFMQHHDTIHTHLTYYYELLIDKYRPELKEEWTAVTRDKEAILKKIREMKKEGKQIDDLFVNDKWKEQHQQYQADFLTAVKKRDEAQIKELLPQILELQKQWNKKHRELLKEN
ncbi:hypothetical protein SAMN05421736_102309 [Evansella caseinilytica]|uniref:Periplasmic heavy metal sensor n=1 Tax=Evansella caseinilytica TaxID=1503961 RepID=A0A1H3KZE7_9BACI|nr:hypothetical protein [Evansella caseinilytica]SDY57460.1 hypothetical protein SAMN05421736_102309 [Evansella caseinilytica]